jgi:regulator of sigma D
MASVASTIRPPARTAGTADDYFRCADQSFGRCRQRLIRYLVKLNQALNDDLADLSQALLSRFCDSLVDYLSAGHFRVFQRLSVPPRAYALIESSTQAGMAFNDRFGDPAGDLHLTDVREALERLARLLSLRFELEDELLCAESRLEDCA